MATTMPKVSPHPPLTRVLRNAGGVLLLLLGVAGLFLPFLQGILFLVLGLALIDLPIKHRAHRWLQRYAWYRWIATRHHAVKRAWQRRRRRRRRS